MATPRSMWTFLSVGVSVVACSSGGSGATTNAASDFPAEPYVTVTSDQAKLRVEVRTAPSQPPVRGTSSIALRVTRPDGGAPVDGLTIEAVPWMEAMGHGTSITPSVSARGNGGYLVEPVSLFMPGAWTLRLHFSGTVDDRAAPVLTVP